MAEVIIGEHKVVAVLPNGKKVTLAYFNDSDEAHEFANTVSIGSMPA